MVLALVSLSCWFHFVAFGEYQSALEKGVPGFTVDADETCDTVEVEFSVCSDECVGSIENWQDLTAHVCTGICCAEWETYSVRGPPSANFLT